MAKIPIWKITLHTGLILLAMAAVAPSAKSVTVQSAGVEIAPPPPPGGSAMIDSDSDRVEAPDGDAIGRDVSAEVSQSGAFGRAQIDRFGNVALQGSLFAPGFVATEVGASSNEFVNPLSLPSRVSSRVIVDGGLFRLLGPRDARIDFELFVFSELGTPIPGAQRIAGSSSFGLQMISDFATAALTTSGLPLNLDLRLPPVTAVNELLLDFTVLDIDLGVAQPNQRFELGYSALIQASSPGFSEIIAWEYRDPLVVSFGPPSFTPLDAEPPMALSEPAGMVLAFLAAGVAFCCAVRRQG